MKIAKGRLFFDNKLLGRVTNLEIPAAGPDSEAFRTATKTLAALTTGMSEEAIDRAMAQPLNPMEQRVIDEFRHGGKYTGTFTVDVESHAMLRAWMMQPYQLEALHRIMSLPTQRVAPFEFGSAEYNRMKFGTENDRRWMPITIKDEAVYGKRAPRWNLYTASTPGKTTSAHVLSHFLYHDEPDFTFGKLGRAWDEPRMPMMRYMPFTINRICKDWSAK